MTLWDEGHAEMPLSSFCVCHFLRLGSTLNGSVLLQSMSLGENFIFTLKRSSIGDCFWFSNRVMCLPTSSFAFATKNQCGADSGKSFACCPASMSFYVHGSWFCIP